MPWTAGVWVMARAREGCVAAGASAPRGVASAAQDGASAPPLAPPSWQPPRRQPEHARRPAPSTHPLRTRAAAARAAARQAAAARAAAARAAARQAVGLVAAPPPESAPVTPRARTGPRGCNLREWTCMPPTKSLGRRSHSSPSVLLSRHAPRARDGAPYARATAPRPSPPRPPRRARMHWGALANSPPRPPRRAPAP